MLKSSSVISVLCVAIFSSCQNLSANIEKDKVKLKDSLFKMYSNKADSVKREAVLFLIDNMDETQTVTYPYFFNKNTNKQVNFNLLEIAGENDFKAELKKRNIAYKDTTVNDAQILTAKYLAGCIDKAYADWKNYPWNRHVSKEMFFNYLLPYKVYNDKPSQWRDLLARQYYLDLLPLDGQRRNSTSENVIDKIPYFHPLQPDPLLTFNENSFKISKSNHFDEMMAIRVGDCLTGNLMNIYRLRAMGIPATMDLIPLWGKLNASHSETVYENSSGKMVALNTTAKNLQQTAKVIRYTYKNQKTWSDTISKLLLNPKEFGLKYLMNNHWIDVTSSYNQVGDINYKIKEFYPDGYAYICVFNYGNWAPVFWGKKNKDEVVFKNMGTDIFYRIAIPFAGQMKFVSEPFLFTRDKKIKFYHNNKQTYPKLNLYKVNTGTASFVEIDGIYTLSYWDETNNWRIVATKKAQALSIDLNSPEVKEKIKSYKITGFSDAAINDLIKNDLELKKGIEFNNVPKNALLKLQKSDDTKGLARIFLIDGLTHKQIWY
ncbi:hypothetical protein [Pedobacter paludis]|uniref:Transglutaminase domain-containing protein n=1 Tax=Pedobacter paludis TaxID=2203212 RepID=A0A317EY71_9SPHI|nr:hypothetical protein [Pedobacter paludis]PWS31784.1 hypothetical protein DF947_08265 [Pedobacter paludis]